MAVLDVRPHERLASTIFAQLRYWPLLIALLACLGISLVVSRRAQRRPS
jgi:apolipoprotein N-acyltransferase